MNTKEFIVWCMTLLIVLFSHIVLVMDEAFYWALLFAFIAGLGWYRQACSAEIYYVKRHHKSTKDTID